MATLIKTMPVSDLEYNEGQMYGLPKNPRWIRDARYEALKKSITDAPEMLELRELMIYPLADIEGHEDKFIVIGGNMRLRACKELGYTEVPCKILPLETPVKKLREYAIKDNEAFGQNDFDILANEWDMEELQEFGMENDYIVKDNEWDDLSYVEEEQEAPSLEKDIKIEITIPSEKKELQEEIKTVIEQALLPYDGIKLK